MPRFDSGSCFGRLLDWDKGGFFSLQPVGESFTFSRDYLGDSLVLVTRFRSSQGEAELYDLFSMRPGGKLDPERQLLRLVKGISGRVQFEARISPRFDYGLLMPWMRRDGVNLFSAIGGSDGLIINSTEELTLTGSHDLHADFFIEAGDTKIFSLTYASPDQLDRERPTCQNNEVFLERYQDTVAWWERWTKQFHYNGFEEKAVLRSAIVLRGMVVAQTGAIIAAPTTSLPEAEKGIRNWDYRYSWIRDSAFATRSLANIGFDSEAEEFMRFIQRSAAGSAETLQIMYGVHGERRLTEVELPSLAGYGGAKPVRIGNGAYDQRQLDCYGTLLNLTWNWHLRGSSPDDDYWRFLVELIDKVCEIWNQPDQGLWESRGRPKHFVHSKVMCWSAVDRGLKLAEQCLRKAPTSRWKATLKEMRATIMEKGIDKKGGNFVQAFGTKQLDSALLLIPHTEFVEWSDPIMLATVDALQKHLNDNGFLLRYRTETMDDGLTGKEGTFLACSFWLAECLANQGRIEEARRVFDNASASCNELGLYAEEFEPERKILLGNFPQGLSHLSHINAAVAISRYKMQGTRL